MSLYEDLLYGRTKEASKIRPVERLRALVQSPRNALIERRAIEARAAAREAMVGESAKSSYIKDALSYGRIVGAGGALALGGTTGPVFASAAAGSGLMGSLAAAAWKLDRARRLRVPKGGPLKWDGRPISFKLRKKSTDGELKSWARANALSLSTVPGAAITAGIL